LADGGAISRGLRVNNVPSGVSFELQKKIATFTAERLAMELQKMPTPIVDVVEIITKSNSYVKVVDGANI